MAKSIGKYFIAIVPEGEIQQKATDLKLMLKEDFNLKYALKSPAHVTLKMPFNWNEAKESKLIDLLTGFCQDQQPFQLKFSGFDKFGKRVIFIKIKENPTLSSFQIGLSKFCKTNLNLVEELVDRAYHPHMTLAFKDLKEIRFAEYWDFIKKQKFEAEQVVQDIALLKRIEGRWVVVSRFQLNGKHSSAT
ncbi:2'-5' RNA ligase family protein [Aquiflexum gelatinilyticum]|uniref:2'-5' RNA ligase family protein n=1 Tax=Aquiflexum gelatinilyticum TaxID=2961943 RepID=UPI002169A033|nr:2'-5' RNA ligase family protein [Aquiflexum gelatinilyticum]MCS4435670.1 2'-5' RNA ligase family protein [Aquiflexum gelatinilyticum]